MHLLFLLALTLPAPPANVRVGYQVVDVQTGEVLSEHAAHEFFVPASNVKLYTAAWALNALGPDYRFHTELRSPAAGHNGVLGELEFVGGGDPNLSRRVLPYDPHAPELDPLHTLAALAQELKQAGIERVANGITGVAVRYPTPIFPDEWEIGDTVYDYGAPVSSLTFEDSTVRLFLHPGDAGDLARIEMSPAIDHFAILDQVETGSTNDIHVTRPPGSNELIVWGTIASDQELDVAVDDPALFAAEALADALREAGISVSGDIASRYCPPSAQACDVEAPVLLAAHASEPLRDILKVMLKESQNLHAEMLLQETTRATHSSREVFLASIGLAPVFFASDGSGLSPDDRTTAAETAALLAYMWKSPYHDLWLDVLPTGSVDGTLQHRFMGVPDANNIHAKTGTLQRGSALSGYVHTNSGRWLVFSIMVDTSNISTRAARQYIDSFCTALLQQ